jgi:hypothetical protein
LSDVSNFAQVQGVSGTFVVPVHTPYDRQMLRDHLARRVGPLSTLTLGMHGKQWTITRQDAPRSQCATCTRSVGRLRCNQDDGGCATCIDCAMRPENGESHGEPIGEPMEDNQNE